MSYILFNEKTKNILSLTESHNEASEIWHTEDEDEAAKMRSIWANHLKTSNDQVKIIEIEAVMQSTKQNTQFIAKSLSSSTS